MKTSRGTPEVVGHAPAPGVARRHSTVLVIAPTPNRRRHLASSVRRGSHTRVAQYGSAHEAQNYARSDTEFDVVVLDGAVHDVPVLSFVRRLSMMGWRKSVLVTPRHDMLGVRAAVLAGVRGYVVASPTPESEPSSPTGLSEREVQVLQCVADGLTNKEAGRRLGLSGLTIKSHLARISRKLGTGDRAELVALAFRQGLVA